MSVTRAVESLNCLPVSLYLIRFFDAYEEYFIADLQRVKNMKAKHSIDKAIQASCIDYLESALEKVKFAKIDVEIISECVKFLRIMDSEYSILRLETIRISREDIELIEEMKALEIQRTAIATEVATIQKQLDCRKALLRMRNINILPTKDKYDIKFCLDDDEYLPEIPTDLTIPVFNVCKDFIQENNYGLAVAFIQESIRNIVQASKNKSSNDVAILHGYMAQIYSMDGDNVHAIEQYRSSIELREKLLDADDPVLGSLLYNYSLSLIKSKKISEAESKLKVALRIKSKEVGSDDMLIAKIHSLIGQCCNLSNKTTDSIVHYKISLAILEKKSMDQSSFAVGLSASLCRDYMHLKQQKSAELCLTDLFKKLHKKLDNKRDETVFDYFRRSLSDANGEYIHHSYGNIESYDICNLIDLLLDYFSPFPAILKAIDTWKLLSLRGK